MDVGLDNPQVSHLVEAVQNHNRKPVEALIHRIRGAVDRFTALPVPLIAAINGNAYGGGAELAVRCDLRVMDPEAVICFSEVRLGLMPDWGGGAALVRLVGPGTATDVLLTARKISAKEAMDMGMINRICRKGRALEEAKTLAEHIVKNGPRAVRSCLSLIRKSPDLSLEKALDMESETAVSLITGGECMHGITAFLSKTDPDFPDV
jgi:enoyl-CoA hydratase